MTSRFAAVVSVAVVVALVVSCQAEATLVAHWSMDENAGATAFDSSGNGNDGAITGATWTSGISGSALDFDPANSAYVNAGNDTSLDLTDAMTINLWLKPDSLAAIATLISKGDPQNYVLYTVGSDMNLYANGAADTGGGAPYLLTEPVSSFTLGAWNHLAVTYDKNAGSAAMYVNGAPVDTGADTDAMIANTQMLYLGASYGSGGVPTPRRFYDGVLDEVSIYSEALDAGAIATLYQNPGTIIPEPTTLSLLVLGGVALLFRRGRRG